MNAYVYQAALLCADCAHDVMAESPKPPADYDSEIYPAGPYPQGAGEADTPQHCDHCNVFLENPLTGDGYDYVAEQLDNYSERGSSRRVLRQWASFYAGEHRDLDRAIEESRILERAE